MTGEWTPLATDFFSDPKVLRAGRDAALLYVAGLCYCQHHLTDGHIPPEAIPMLCVQSWTKPAAAATLVREGMWLPGYEVNGWLEWNRSAEEIAERREADARRKKAWRDAKAGGTRHGRDASRDASEDRRVRASPTPTPTPTTEKVISRVKEAYPHLVDYQRSWDPAKADPSCALCNGTGWVDVPEPAEAVDRCDCAKRRPA